MEFTTNVRNVVMLDMDLIEKWEKKQEYELNLIWCPYIFETVGPPIVVSSTLSASKVIRSRYMIAQITRE